ncbi:MAG: nitrous oxide reductase accessory protein NosL [Burkholderiales bacterium]|nr:nitrous oxide reductase accessory protein NosL [Burkholderiales bacterium]
MAVPLRRWWPHVAVGLAVVLIGVATAAFNGRGASTESAPLAVPPPLQEVCVVAPPTPYDPSSGQPLSAPRAVPRDARCPVCGMYPARSLHWAAQVIFVDGDAQFFDSPLTLLMYLQEVGRYSPGRKADQIVAHYVTDTVGKQWIDARQAVYVQGSTAVGPMRAGNLPAFASVDAARRFAQQRGGVVVAFNDIDPAEVRRLGGQRRHEH